MKHVFNSDEIPHLWMHQSQSDARNGQGNLYFNGDTIYSYGSHFPIARHVLNAKGEKAVLFTTRSYSMTTSHHLSRVRCAIPSDVLVLDTSDPTANPSKQVELFDERITTAEKACFGDTGRFRPKYWAKLSELIAEANAVSEFFGSKCRWTMPVDTSAIKEALAKEESRRKRQEAQNRRAQAKREAEQAAKQVEALEHWKAGEDIRYWGNFDRCPTALRIKDGEVETSRGARVPVEHALRGLKFVRAVVAAGKEYVRNGHTFHLGVYAIDRVTVEGKLYAGCHIIDYAEIERIAPELEALPEAPPLQTEVQQPQSE